MRTTSDAYDWSCPHGGRWIRWGNPKSWMNVVMPLVLDEKAGRIRKICKCNPEKGTEA